MKLLERLRTLSRKNAVRQGSIVLVDQGALSIATFVVGILVARACPQEVYGLYVLGWSILLALQGFHKALVNVPFTVYAPRLPPDERAVYQGSTLIHTAVLGLVLALAIHALGIWNPLGQEPKLAGVNELLPLLAVIMIPFLTRDFLRNAMLAQLEVSASVRVNLTATALLVAATVTLFALDRLTLAWSFHLYSLTSALAAGYMLWAYRTRIQIAPGKIWGDLKKGWRIGKWISMNTIGFMAASQAYPWLLLYFADATAVAVFGACLGTAGLLTPLLRGATAYILPRMSHANKDGNTRELARMLRLSILVLTLPYGIWFIIGSLFGNELVTFFYSDTYSGYGLLVALLLGKTLIESASAPLTNALQTLERTDMTTVSLAIGAVVTLGPGSIMIQQMGVLGAGYAYALSSAATAGWKWMAIKRILHGREASDG